MKTKTTTSLPIIIGIYYSTEFTLEFGALVVRSFLLGNPSHPRWPKADWGGSLKKQQFGDVK